MQAYQFGMHGIDWIALIGVVIAALALKVATNRLR